MSSLWSLQVMEQAALRELIDATPACVLSASLASMLSCCDRSRSEQVVIRR
ncbi:MAG: hypothetical protein HC895_26560 [Leptolyngbyaceae cyanobacterium SM1_3_5]|nr:hypothetical protein [Leptolyngbyaceae cyanobacterium SM1_3_5]